MSTYPDTPEFAGWHRSVQGYAELFLGEAAISGAGASLAVPPVVPPRVVLCSPHPDDEALTGLLPLRLKEENGAQVVNLAMTLGSNPARRAARRDELLRACGVLGFAVRVAKEPEGLPMVSVLARGREPALWQAQVADLTALFADLRPELLLFPHAADSHPTHIGTHFLALAAALSYSRATGASILVAETEYWHPNPAPNLLVGASVEQLALLLTALAEHRGEMARYPYHRAMPPRMLDTVRRCSELVQGYGSAPPPLVFGEAYAFSAIRQGVWQRGSGALTVVPTEALTMDRLVSAFAMPRC